MKAVLDGGLKEGLQEVRKQSPENLAAQLVAIGSDCAPRLAHLPDHATLLYGNKVLPTPVAPFM